jgi:hypothetical protein
MKNYFLCCLFIVVSFVLKAQNGNPILIDTMSRFDIRNYGYFYEDKGLKATVDTIISLKKQNRLTPLSPGRTFNKGLALAIGGLFLIWKTPYLKRQIYYLTSVAIALTGYSFLNWIAQVKLHLWL